MQSSALHAEGRAEQAHAPDRLQRAKLGLLTKAVALPRHVLLSWAAGDARAVRPLSRPQVAVGMIGDGVRTTRLARYGPRHRTGPCADRGCGERRRARGSRYPCGLGTPTAADSLRTPVTGAVPVPACGSATMSPAGEQIAGADRCERGEKYPCYAVPSANIARRVVRGGGSPHAFGSFPYLVACMIQSNYDTM